MKSLYVKDSIIKNYKNRCRKIKTIDENIITIIQDKDIVKINRYEDLKIIKENKNTIKEKLKVIEENKNTIKENLEEKYVVHYEVKLNDALKENINYYRIMHPLYLGKNNYNYINRYRMDDELNYSVKGFSILYGIIEYFYSYFYPKIYED